MKSILFVCMGNICRSPAAEEIFRQLTISAGVESDYYLDSAGTYAGHTGELPDVRMRDAAGRRGLVLTHRARGVRAVDFDKFDMIVAMDDDNYERLHRLAPDEVSADRIYRMVEFGNQKQYDHIPDPYYEGADGFELVLDLLQNCCAGLLTETAPGRH